MNGVDDAVRIDLRTKLCDAREELRITNKRDELKIIRLQSALHDAQVSAEGWRQEYERVLAKYNSLAEPINKK